MSRDCLRILVTGANGFIGKNLIVRLEERQDNVISTFVRGDDVTKLPKLVAEADTVVHLAGVNRPAEEFEFSQINTGLTKALCKAVSNEFSQTGRRIPILMASSIQAELENPYGRSKLEAEKFVQELSDSINSSCIVFRLPGVFGKWCKPNYNSVVATFCFNVSRDLPLTITSPNKSLILAYIDDVVDAFIKQIFDPSEGFVNVKVNPEYNITLQELAEQILAFRHSRNSLLTQRVGSGIVRALYSTYISYLPQQDFLYTVPQYVDPRGVFVEMLKTHDSGQFSYFTAHPGVTRGGHYHHSKTEKFLVIRGNARFRFRHLLTDELIEFTTCADTPQIVDTIPGWTHDITNVGQNEMLVLLWANENFDRDKPDTIARKI